MADPTAPHRAFLHTMPGTFSTLLRCTLAALGLLALGGCLTGGAKRWAGDYEAGIGRLQLHPTGEFAYDGGGCFPPHSDSDVGFADEFAGHYRMQGPWIVLEPTDPGYIEGCSGTTLKLHGYRAHGRRYLFDERYLRSIAHDVRRGVPPDRFHPWHVAGEPAELVAAPADLLPEPLAAESKLPPPAGRVVSIGPVQRRTRYGSAGRVEGEELFAMLTVDFGRRHGAFAGLPVCTPGRPGRYWLEAAAEDTATLRWAWSPSGEGEPVAGMRLDSACNDQEAGAR
jgi:hypothetical protein